MSKSNPPEEKKSVNIAQVPQFEAQIEPFENYIPANENGSKWIENFNSF